MTLLPTQESVSMLSSSNGQLLYQRLMNGGTFDPSTACHATLVNHFTTTFLMHLVFGTPGGKGRKYVKAQTLCGWMHSLVSCISIYCTTDNGDRCRSQLLTSSGLYCKLDDHTAIFFFCSANTHVFQ